ncbi:MAG TPA: hypothetical protein DGH68_10370 [Bacteroidetes bacterium]|nr:hypothetical protein [Bacteroidota bacterium]
MSKLHFRDRSFVIETYRQQITAYQKLFDFDKYLRVGKAGRQQYIRDAKTAIASLAIVEEELRFLVSEKRKHIKRDPLKTVQDEAHLAAVRAIMNNLQTNLNLANTITSTAETKPKRIKMTRKQ